MRFQTGAPAGSLGVGEALTLADPKRSDPVSSAERNAIEERSSVVRGRLKYEVALRRWSSSEEGREEIRPSRGRRAVCHSAAQKTPS